MSDRLKDIIISSVISIAITIIFGYYFLYVGTKEREPTFYLDPLRTTIIDRSTATTAPITLLKRNGDSIDSDVVSVYFYFFNQGKETIKQENIYSPLRITLSDSAEILDYKILKVSRDVSGVELIEDTVKGGLLINFHALEYNDGFAGQLIYEGSKDARVIIEGGIEGTTAFKDKLSNVDPLYVVIALAILLIAAYILLVMNKRNTKVVPKFLFVFSALPVLYLLLMLYKTEWFIDHTVPEPLRIDQYMQQTKKRVPDVAAWFGK
jgi:hypothetical protein